MGRYSTGAITVGDCLRLNIKEFTPYLKPKIFRSSGTIAWTNGANIGFEINCDKTVRTLTLSYSRSEGETKHPINYKVQIVEVPSNLGKGKVYYFICPFSFQKCRVLYMGYGSLYFKSRKAYKHRIYYYSQLSSRLDRHNDIYWRLERKLEGMGKKKVKTHYQGKVTRTQTRINKMKEKRRFHEIMRWKVLPAKLQKIANLTGITDPMELIYY